MIPSGPWRNSSDEDAASVLRGETPLRRWAAVTASGSADTTYHIRTFDTYTEACDFSVENVSNDLYRETPEVLCDLDGQGQPWGLIYVLMYVTAYYRPSTPD